jgi:hypothetical protein
VKAGIELSGLYGLLRYLTRDVLGGPRLGANLKHRHLLRRDQPERQNEQPDLPKQRYGLIGVRRRR